MLRYSSLIALLLPLFYSMAFAGEVTVRYALQPGTNYQYQLTVQQTNSTLTNDETTPMVVTSSMSGIVTSEVAASADNNHFPWQINYVMDEFAFEMDDAEAQSTLTMADLEYQRELVDARGFSSEDVQPLGYFAEDLAPIDLPSYSIRPVLSAFYIMELPEPAMAVGDHWTTNKPMFVHFANHPTIGFKYTLVSASEVRHGIPCAKFSVEIVNGEIAEMTHTDDLGEVGVVENTVNEANITMDGTLWFDLAGGKIVEWNANVTIYLDALTVDPAQEEYNNRSNSETSIVYRYLGTRPARNPATVRAAVVTGAEPTVYQTRLAAYNEVAGQTPRMAQRIQKKTKLASKVDTPPVVWRYGYEGARVTITEYSDEKAAAGVQQSQSLHFENIRFLQGNTVVEMKSNDPARQISMYAHLSGSRALLALDAGARDGAYRIKRVARFGAEDAARALARSGLRPEECVNAICDVGGKEVQINLLDFGVDETPMRETIKRAGLEEKLPLQGGVAVEVIDPEPKAGRAADLRQAIGRHLPR